MADVTRINRLSWVPIWPYYVPDPSRVISSLVPSCLFGSFDYPLAVGAVLAPEQPLVEAVDVEEVFAGDVLDLFPVNEVSVADGAGVLVPPVGSVPLVFVLPFEFSLLIHLAHFPLLSYVGQFDV